MKNKKSTFLTVLLLFLAAMTMVSCKSETDTVFTIITEDYNGSKAYIANNTILYWSNGDQVRVNSDVYTVAVNGETSKATIDADGVTSFNGNYYAIYPADNTSILVDGTVQFALPEEEQYQFDGTYQVMNNIMAAHSTGSTLKMKNLCSVLCFSLASSVDGMKICAIEVSSDKAMWGSMSAVPNGEGWDVTLPVTGDNLKRTLRFDSPVALSSIPRYFYLQVPPSSNVNDFTVRYYVENASGVVSAFQRTKNSAASFVAGTMYGFDELSFSGGTPANYTSVSLGTEENKYRIFSSEGWTAAGLTSSTKKYFSLESDITVSTRIENFYSELEGNGHTVTLSGGASSLIGTMKSNSSVSNLTVDAPSTFNSVIAVNNYYFGFVACYAESSTTITNCVNKCSLNLPSNTIITTIGGVCARTSGNVYDCKNEGDLSVQSVYLGGIVGDYRGPRISGCVNSGALNQIANGSYLYCGGVVGDVASSSTEVSDCYNENQVTVESNATTYSFIGGVFGRIMSNLTNCGNNGLISCTPISSNKDVYVGGVLGRHSYLNTGKKEMTNCYNMGKIQFSTQLSHCYAGGLVGTYYKLDIFNSFALCDIDGRAAGIVYFADMMEGCEIANCYYYGTINNENKHGIVSLISSYSVTANYCYYPTGLTSISGCSEVNCAQLSDSVTLTDGSPLLSKLNEHRGSWKEWEMRNGIVMLKED